MVVKPDNNSSTIDESSTSPIEGTVRISGPRQLPNEDSGLTLYHKLALKGRLDLIRSFAQTQLLDVNARSGNGATILHFAAISGNLELVKYLVEELGCDINAKDMYGNTPLDYAEACSHSQ